MIDGHGDDLFRYAGKVKVNFSTNIPQRVNHDGLLAHLAGCGAIFRNYPEPEPRSVERQLAEIHSTRPGNVIVTNGATEAIYLIAQLFTGERSAIIAPTFREYQDACRVYGHDIAFITSLDEAGRNGVRVVWLCNPNNPTGSVFDRRRLLEVIDLNPDKLFVVDQAYARYAVRPVLSEPDVVARQNVILLNSLTKQFVVPGLRIGYAIGPESIIDRLRAIRMPWAVNAIAIEAARYLLSHADDYEVDYRELHAEALRLADAMGDMGIEAVPTDCNFILARLPDRSAARLKEWLVETHGLLIRDAANFEGLSPRHFRVAAQSREENNQLIDALKEWMSL